MKSKSSCLGIPVGINAQLHLAWVRIDYQWAVLLILMHEPEMKSN